MSSTDGSTQSRVVHFNVMSAEINCLQNQILVTLATVTFATELQKQNFMTKINVASTKI